MMSPCFFFSAMSTSENKVEIVDRGHKEEEEKEEGEGGFLDKVKDFIHDIGEKIEGTIGFGKPTADVSAIHIPKINLERADIVVDVLVKNPNPVPIPLIDIDYLVESDGRKLVSGLIPDAGTLKAHGEETVKIPLSLIYDDINSTYNDINPGMIIPYRIKVDLIVDVPVLGRLTLPLEKRGEIPIPKKPNVDVEKIKFQKFSLEETVAILHVRLENMNDFDLGLNDLDCEVWLCDVSIGKAEISDSIKLDKNGSGLVNVPMTFRPKDFGSALWDMIRGKGTGYTIKGNVDVDTPFGAMKLPIIKEGGETRLKKEDDDDEVGILRERAQENEYHSNVAHCGAMQSSSFVLLFFIQQCCSSSISQFLHRFCRCSTEQNIGGRDERKDAPHGHELNDRKLHATRYDAHRNNHQQHPDESKTRREASPSCRNKRQDP
uniref:Water stress and hypersensitive response domain-containing protein n=1 Tax=Brassica oleracea TaxID=3712 RepID=A0A3P6D6Y5_BRAOL|nr:unnamed protein product [Brassica oleracea]